MKWWNFVRSQKMIQSLKRLVKTIFLKLIWKCISMKSRHTLKDGYLDKSYVLSIDHENSPDHCYESLWSNYNYETYVHTNGRELLSEYLAECNPDKLWSWIA